MNSIEHRVDPDPGLVRTVITTYGVLHGDAPTHGMPVISVDLRTGLHNPHHDPGMRFLTGLDAVVRDHVLATPGAQEIVVETVGRVLAAHRGWTNARNMRQDVHVFCKGGRHRSVAVAEEVAARLRSLGHGVEVEHRDVDKPVVEVVMVDGVRTVRPVPSPDTLAAGATPGAIEP